MRRGRRQGSERVRERARERVERPVQWEMAGECPGASCIYSLTDLEHNYDCYHHHHPHISIVLFISVPVFDHLSVPTLRSWRLLHLLHLSVLQWDQHMKEIVVAAHR